MKKNFTQLLPLTTLILAGIALISGLLQWFFSLPTVELSVLPIVLGVLIALPITALFLPQRLSGFLRYLQRLYPADDNNQPRSRRPIMALRFTLLGLLLFGAASVTSAQNLLRAMLGLVAFGTLRSLQEHSVFFHSLRMKKAICFLQMISVFCLILLGHGLNAQVTGTIFRDYNANGIRENTAPTAEPGQSGVVVQATNAAGTALTVTYTGGGTATNSTGGYTVTGGTLGQVRLEFVMPDNFTFASSGNVGGTTVMFPSTATQNLAVNYPADYCEGTRDVIVPCFLFGSPTLFGTFETSVSDPFTTRVIQESLINHNKKLSTQSQTGSVYGNAYSRQTGKTYLSAFYKRYSGFGPGNGNPNGSTGAIYELDGVGGVSVLIDLPATETGVNPHPNTVDFQRDPSWFESGKIAWGDIDISDDGKTLYAMNLFNRKLYEIDIATQTVTTSTFIPGITGGAAFTGPTADNNTDLRPFAVKYYKGKVYVGVVCTAESEFTSLTSDDKGPNVRGFVFVHTPGTGFSGTPVLSFDMGRLTPAPTYLRGINNFRGYSKWVSQSASGTDWTDSDVRDAGENKRGIISDIEFINDNMLIGIRDLSKDRFAAQAGTFYPNGTTAVSAGAGSGGSNGLLLKACVNTSGGYTMENAGVCGGVSGFNGFTFYRQHEVHDPAGDHMGAIAVLPSEQIIVTNNLPGSFAGATSFISESTRTYERDDSGINLIFAYINNPTIDPLFGKANGLGDIEIACTLQPLEIGNRVWMDTDNDGIQDAGEMGIGSITVKLYQGATQVGETITAADGTFYFNNSTVNLNGATGLLPDMAYVIRVDAADFPSGKSLSTNQNIGGAGQPDVRDNDAALNAGNAEITVTTGKYGENNHTLDMAFKVGFTCINPSGITFTQTPANCSSTNVPQNNGSITLSSANNGTHYGISTLNAATYDGPTTVAGATAISLPQTIASSIPNTGGTYIVRIFNAADDCYTDQTVTAPTISCTCPVLPCAGTIVTKNN